MTSSATTLPRLLSKAGAATPTYREHITFFGALTPSPQLFTELDASGLLGRGGAGFPTAKKVALLREQRQRNKFVVVNAMEGEPAAHKDRTLMATNPHLIIDGAECLAAMIGASHVAICVARDNPASAEAMKRAIEDRPRSGSRDVTIELHTPPWRYVAGEESALVHWLNDNESLPQYRAGRPSILKIGRAPVLVDNAETCANVALIARYGASWFRGLGTAGHPGSTLVSVSGAVERPTVLEVAMGTPIADILNAAGADSRPQALLLGGYGGLWLDGRATSLPYANDGLSSMNATVGAGIIVAIPEGACGLLETTHIAKWMANESARQCGPCAFGLPAIADDLTEITYGTKNPAKALDRLKHRLGEVDGHGACKHPDGVVRMVRSALTVFETDLHNHLQGRACQGSRARRYYVAVPTLENEEELVWE
jgi:NADH:ubiquinone oxidoreductase subunit F (NADH-binding)